MSFRTVNGNTHTEDGWRCCNRDECDIVRLPDLFLVDTAPIRKGAPLIILGAWLYYYDRKIEEIIHPVWGWSESNDVLGQPGKNNGSNHLGGTAIDVMAPKYPWKTYRMTAEVIAKVEVGLDLFSIDGESGVFWGGHWPSAYVDQMHYQMAWPEGDPRNDRLAQKLLDGYLGIYKKDTDTSSTPTTPVPNLTRAEKYALAIIKEGQRLGITPRGIMIALSVALVETNLTMYANSNDPPSLNYPHDAVGSDHMSSGLFQQQTAWGSLADRMDPTRSANIFFTIDNGPGVRGLTKIKAGNGRLLDYNNESNSPGWYAQKVQGSAFPDRYDQRWNDAVALYNKLVPLTIEGDPFMALSDSEQREILGYLRWLAAPETGEFRKKFPSRSGVREPNEGLVDTFAGMELNTDGNVDFLATFQRAKLGFPPAIARLERVAAGQELNRNPDDALLAQAILAEINAPKTEAAYSDPPPPETLRTPESVAVSAPPTSVVTTTMSPDPMQVLSAPSVSNGTTLSKGQVIGQAYDALEALLTTDALNEDEKAPLRALISVLQTKIGDSK